MAKKSQLVIGRWFDTEKGVIQWLKKKEKQLIASGLTVGPKWWGKHRILCSSTGFLLVGEELEYGLADHGK